MRIVLFLLLYAALLACFGQSVFTVLRVDRFFDRRAGERRKARENRALQGGDSLARYRVKLAMILKNSAFDIGVDGLLRFKVLLSAAGLGAGLLMKNPMLALVLLVGLFWLPDAYFRLSSLRYAKEVGESVETAMSIITNSYLQNEDIKSAILENISRIERPLKEVFREFLAETGFVDASVRNAILRMKLKADNAYFGDWCDILLQCQDDRELKYVLPSIVTKLNSVKRIQAELDTVMFDIYKEFAYVVGIVVLNLPLMALINAEWADMLFHTPVGKLAVAVCFSVVFLASAYVVSVNQPLAQL
ncbi:MAG: hypothetical protein LBU58_11335 [Clostridiales bacterium]|jgi:hypothetical protein|nr:hypothetical protein [Clostridiales bacterium]